MYGRELCGGFFEKFIVQLDYPNKKMRLMTRDAIDIRKVENVRMESDKGSGFPIVWVRLNDEISDWLILDTGSNDRTPEILAALSSSPNSSSFTRVDIGETVLDFYGAAGACGRGTSFLGEVRDA